MTLTVVQRFYPAWSSSQSKGSFCRTQRPRLLLHSQSNKKVYQQPGLPLLWDAGEITYSLQLLQPWPWRVQPFLDTAVALLLLSINSLSPTSQQRPPCPISIGLFSIPACHNAESLENVRSIVKVCLSLPAERVGV